MNNILIINNGFRLGGIEIASCSFANYCAKQGYGMTILATSITEHQIVLDSRVKIIEPTILIQNSRLKTLAYIRRNAKRIKPDVIVAHGESTNGFVSFALWGLRIPLFLQDHMNPRLIGRLGFLHTVFNGFFYPRATGLIALSNYSKQMMEEKYKAKNVAVIPNPIREISIESGKEEKSVVCIGRLSKEKGHRFLVEAWNSCQHEGWRLDIVGDGPEMENLKKQSADDKSIIFHGFQTDVAKYLTKARIFVLPSLSECFPLALIEAMSVGKACVSTRCLSGNDIIVHDNIDGLSVEPGNAEQLAKAMETLMNDETLCGRLSAEARKIKEELSEDVVYGKYLNFIGLK